MAARAPLQKRAPEQHNGGLGILAGATAARRTLDNLSPTFAKPCASWPAAAYPHACPGSVHMGCGQRPGTWPNFDQLLQTLAGQCSAAVIHIFAAPWPTPAVDKCSGQQRSALPAPSPATWPQPADRRCADCQKACPPGPAATHTGRSTTAEGAIRAPSSCIWTFFHQVQKTLAAQGLARVFHRLCPPLHTAAVDNRGARLRPCAGSRSSAPGP